MEQALAIDAADLSRLEQAQAYDQEIVRLYDRAAQLWYEVGRVVTPFKREKLYRELGFTSWEDYCQKRFGKRDTSINNYVKPYELLEEAGQNPDEFRELPQARVREIAAVALVKGNVWTDEEKRELIEVGKARKPRGKPDKLSVEAGAARKQLALDVLRILTLRLAESQYGMWQTCMDVLEVVCVNENGRHPSGQYPAEFKFELLLNEFLKTPLAIVVLKALEGDYADETDNS